MRVGTCIRKRHFVNQYKGTIIDDAKNILENTLPEEYYRDEKFFLSSAIVCVVDLSECKICR